MGRRRLLTGAALVNACLGSLFAWSIFVEPLKAEFRGSDEALPWVFSLALATFAAVVMAGGRLVDRLPPARIVVVAAFCTGGGMLAAAAAPSLVWLAVGYGVLFGVGNGLGYAAAVAVASKAFVAQRGTALGLVVGAYAAGPLVAGPLASSLLVQVGLRATFALFGIVLAGLLLLGAVLLAVPGAQARPADEGGSAASRAPVRPLLLQPRALLLWTVFLLGTLPALLVFAHAAAIVGEQGLGRTAAGAAVAVLGAGNLTGRVGSGWLSDHFGRLPSLRVALLGLMIACGLLAAVSVPAVIFTALLLVGVAYGSQAALVPAVTADLFGVPGFAGNYGQIFTAWGVAGLLGPAAGAWLHDLGNGFEAALWLASATVLGALAATAAIERRSHEG